MVTRAKRGMYDPVEAYAVIGTAIESSLPAGKSRKKVVPCPTVLSRENPPLVARSRPGTRRSGVADGRVDGRKTTDSMIWRTMNNPQPVPLPGSFVMACLPLG